MAWKHVIYRHNKAIGWLTRTDKRQVGQGGYLYNCFCPGDQVAFKSVDSQGQAEKEVLLEHSKREQAK